METVEGARIKFRTIFRKRQRPADPGIAELGRWCGVFSEKNMAPLMEDGASAGNLSFRTKDGVIITASGLKSKDSLGPESFVRVLSFDLEKMEAVVEGLREPSSDTPAHSLIYSRRPEVNAVFHGHDPLILKHAERLGASTQKEAFFGTKEDLEELEKIVPGGDYLVRKGHGFFALGKTMEEAGSLALWMRKKAEGLEIAEDGRS